MNNIARILKNIEEEKKVDYNNIFSENRLSDVDALAIIVFCLKNKIDDVSETLDINFENINEQYFSDSEVVDYFTNYLEMDEDYGDEVLNKFSKIVLLESIKNTKINFSVLDIKQEGLLSMLKFKNDYYEKLSQNYNKEELEYIFRYFIKKSILSYQKNELDSVLQQEYLSLLYIKINSELNSGDDLENILNRIGITKEYYEEMKKIYGSSEEELSYQEIVDEMDRIKRKYEIAMKVNKINYLEESSLISYLGLEGTSEVKKTEDIISFIKNTIFKLSLIYSIEILDDLENSYEVEGFDVKFD